MDVEMIDPVLSAESDEAVAHNTISATATSPHRTRKAKPTKTEEDDDDHSIDGTDSDPIVARFKILTKPAHLENRTVTILEHTNKSDGKKPLRQPLELRTKPTTGMLELDMPVDYSAHYDRSKGLAWGSQLHKSTEAKKGGSHGLAGGFGVGAPPPRAARGRGAGGAAAAEEILDMGMDWTEALRKDYVLRTQTLGGQVPEKGGGESKYHIAVFSKGALHIVPSDSLIHLRPQLHHLDAATEQERLARGGTGGAAAAGAGTGKEAARAIHMTIKQSGSGGDEDVIQETMMDRLKKVQTEHWRRHRYVHDEAADSWAVSEEALYLEEPAAEAEGKGKEPAAAAAGNDADGLTERLSALHTSWEEDAALETTSGIQKENKVKTEVADDEPKTTGKGKAKAVAKSATAKPAATTRGKKAPDTAHPASNQDHDGAASASAASAPTKAARTTRTKKSNASSSMENN